MDVVFFLTESKYVQDAHFKRRRILACTLLCICKPISTLMYMPNHLLLLYSALFAPDNSAKRLMSYEYRKQTFLGSTDGDERIANRTEASYTWVLFFNYFQGWRSCRPQMEDHERLNAIKLKRNGKRTKKWNCSSILMINWKSEFWR